MKLFDELNIFDIASVIQSANYEQVLEFNLNDEDSSKLEIRSITAANGIITITLNKKQKV